ncbi:MAG TPA: 2-octaprenyl-6-methoxyphenyl hydroxylase [Gammaproteobacteria bacterium]|jgi:2-octaprenyl-6-methoxyphenol hydroxylase|nr:2-octaprenyl-6-methoxyphenyl hydroxylase [Gammaproteobacteria bacterium]
MQQYDVIISGGGMVGSLLACALSGHGMKIAVIESVRRETREQAGYDERAIALAWGTRCIFAGLGLWEQLERSATAIHSIHVSDRGRPGMVRMDRESEGLPAIGYVVPARVIASVLDAAVLQLDDVDIYNPALLDSATRTEEQVSVVVRQGDTSVELQAALLVGADGADSLLRKQAGIGSRETDYRQTAIVTNVTPQLAHENIAYERFTPDGPIALLPMSEQRCGVVLTVPSAQADAVMALDDRAFLDELQARFGQRLGRLQRVGLRQAWPLRLVSATASVAGRLVLVGNAVHTLHPVAGQGFNLGARDVAVLAEVLVDAHRAGIDPGGAEVVSRYGDWRYRDHRNVTLFTDGLVRLFAVSLPVFSMVRSAGMLALDMLPPARRLLTRLTMGRSERTPRLARGLPL